MGSCKMHRNPKMLFRDYELSNIIEHQKRAIVAQIQSESDEYLFQINKEEYLKYILDEILRKEKEKEDWIAAF